MPRKANRHHYTPEEKAHWAIEVLKGEQTLAQLSSESGVHVNQLRQWRDALVAHAGDVFASDKPALRELQEAHEREKTELYAEIGQLTTQVNWLKKIWRPVAALTACACWTGRGPSCRLRHRPACWA